MSDDTTILEGPDGRLYEIPDAELARYAVPGHRVAELRARSAGAAPAMPDGHFGPDNIPPGHPAAREPIPSQPGNGQPSSLRIETGGNGHGGVVLNFYFGGAAAPSMVSGASDEGVEGYHMTFDESGIPVNHTEMLWGDYIDKQGNPSVGWHSHDPITGNAQ